MTRGSGWLAEPRKRTKFEAQERAVRKGEVTNLPVSSTKVMAMMAILAQNLRSKTVQKTDSSNIINLPKRAGRSCEVSAGKDVKLMTWKIPSKISREFAWKKNAGACVVSRIGMGGSWSAIWLGFMGFM